MKCEYCGTDGQQGTKCARCGAPLPEKRATWKSEPFFYNGYVCYTMRDPMTDVVEVQFWLGRELIERIRVPKEVLRHNVPEWCEAMPFFWDLFLLAHGEKDVIIWQEKNDKYPATFEVRRIENPERERLNSLSLRDIAREFVR